LGPTVGISVLQRHLAQAAEEMITVIRAAEQAEEQPATPPQQQIGPKSRTS